MVFDWIDSVVSSCVAPVVFDGTTVVELTAIVLPWHNVMLKSTKYKWRLLEDARGSPATTELNY